MQSLSSQLPAAVLSEGLALEERPIRILDATAAPGGKTTHLASLLAPNVRIDACERSPIRFDRMSHNVRLQGAQDFVALHRTDVFALKKLFAPESFDAILLDAPCSADGRFRPEDPRTYAYWDSSVPLQRAKVQADMLRELVVLLRPGGTLVYSTCTLAPEENESVISDLLLDDDAFDILPIDHSFPGAYAGLLSFR